MTPFQFKMIMRLLLWVAKFLILGFGRLTEIEKDSRWTKMINEVSLIEKDYGVYKNAEKIT